MAKISTETIENLREFIDRGCDHAGTQEVVDDIVYETLKELGADCPFGDEIGLFDGDSEFCTLDEFANAFWDKAIEKILHVLKTE